MRVHGPFERPKIAQNGKLAADGYVCANMTANAKSPLNRLNNINISIIKLSMGNPFPGKTEK
ncbi:TPA: hypothetical protein HA351_02525 [Methanosarcinaceae archaeon]|nr:hypothetical protein [Methanosarcinaceae archaeon]